MCYVQIIENIVSFWQLFFLKYTGMRLVRLVGFFKNQMDLDSNLGSNTSILESLGESCSPL